MARLQFARAAEEQPVEGHGVVHAGPGENQAVGAAEGGDHDGPGHIARHGRRSQHARDHRGRHPILGSVLDGVERQDAEVDEITSEVEQRDDADAERQRERQVAARIAHFGGGEGYVVPGVG